MLHLNKSIPINEIVTTVSGNVTSLNTSFSLTIHSPFTKKEKQIDLGTNYSPYPERYDLFKISSAEFTSLELGFYTYKICDSDSINNSLEVGYLKIVDTNINDTIRPASDESSNEFIVYHKK